jgi:pimeloyl-ACP methyl ester carboxylesterase
MGEYVDVGGIKTWYDTAGASGEPLILLHGGMVTNDTWGMQMPVFAERFRVFAPERRAHGHTPDVEGPLTYEDMAQDTIGFLETVVKEPAHLVGWSDGGNVALLVASQRPDLVSKIVVIGANYDSDGGVAPFPPVEAAHSPDFAMFRSMYEASSPDGPDHWPVMFEKVVQMWTNFHMSVEDLGRIEAPTLVMSGDDDMISLEHTIAMYRAIPKSELATVPGTSHALLMEKADLANRIIIDFLSNDPVTTMIPFRRATSEHG